MEEKNMLKLIDMLVARISDLEERLSLAEYLRNTYKAEIDQLKGAQQHDEN